MSSVSFCAFFTLFILLQILSLSIAMEDYDKFITQVGSHKEHHKHEHTYEKKEFQEEDFSHDKHKQKNEKEEISKGDIHHKNYDEKEEIPKGVIDFEYYRNIANRFVGLNPVSGDGSGFIFRESSGTHMKGEGFGDAPESGGNRNNLCTCECKPSDSGIGCAGHAGINFRYSSLLWVDPFSQKWTGQMQALQLVTGAELNFHGTDTRLTPGGPAVYNVACTQQDCGDLFAGVFRQYNDRVSCMAALAEEESDSSSCLVRCGESGVYKEWLEYCKGETDTSQETGFRGYDH